MPDIAFRPSLSMFSVWYIMSAVLALVMVLAAWAGVIVTRRRIGTIPPHVRKRRQAHQRRADGRGPLVAVAVAILLVLSPLSYPLIHFRDEIHLGNDQLKLASGRVIPLRTAVLWTNETHGSGKQSWSCTWFMTKDRHVLPADDDFWRFQTAAGETVGAYLAQHYGVVEQRPPFTACTAQHGVVRFLAADSAPK